MLKNEGFQRYLRNTSWLFVDRVVRLAAVLVSSIFITRYLGPSLFGELNYASAFVGIFLTLTSMGLDDIVARDLVRDPGKRDRILGTAAFIKLGGAALLFVIVGALAFLKGLGVPLIDEAPRVGARGHKVAFVHPKATGGVLVELVEPIEGH